MKISHGWLKHNIFKKSKMLCNISQQTLLIQGLKTPFSKSLS
jgi:hypothetical protein